MKQLTLSLATMAALTLAAPVGAQSKKSSFKKSISNFKSNVQKFSNHVQKNFHSNGGHNIHHGHVKKNCHTNYCPPVKKVYYHNHHRHYTHCPSHIHSYNCHYRNWGHYCWLPNYNCYGYYCPTRRCWYYFYQPWNCYLPVSYANSYQPTPVNIAPPVSGGAPALPPGATPVPGGQVPPLPGQ